MLRQRMSAMALSPKKIGLLDHFNGGSLGEDATQEAKAWRTLCGCDWLPAGQSGFLRC